VSQVRIGKRIELQFDRQVSESDLADARKLAAEFLSNDVIEDVVSITVESIA
jgi:phosphoribosylformylglycinamidine synthase